MYVAAMCGNILVAGSSRGGGRVRFLLTPLAVVDVLAILPFDLPFLGIGVLALPTGILGAGFVAELRANKRPARTCPHCGKPLPAG